MNLLHYENMKKELQKAIDSTKGSIECARLVDVMRILELSAELVTCDPYEGKEDRIIEIMYNILS